MSSSSLSLSSHSVSESIPMVDRKINPIGANFSSESFSVKSDFQNAQVISMVESTVAATDPFNGISSKIPLAHVMGKDFDLKMMLTMASKSKTNPVVENPILQPSKRPKLKAIQAAPTRLIPRRETNTEVPKTVENPVAMPTEITHSR
ncbi:hypothetical protein VNO80_01499 [Phaseolus coccineus]|uniref:Uncharacterized protein n=1 Tax=Phaseolus coccineus TaxID=3886 RepID=A0AAN9RSW5_PHACN